MILYNSHFCFCVLSISCLIDAWFLIGSIKTSGSIGRSIQARSNVFSVPHYQNNDTLKQQYVWELGTGFKRVRECESGAISPRGLVPRWEGSETIDYWHATALEGASWQTVALRSFKAPSWLSTFHSCKEQSQQWALPMEVESQWEDVDLPGWRWSTGRRSRGVWATAFPRRATGGGVDPPGRWRTSWWWRDPNRPAWRTIRIHWNSYEDNSRVVADGMGMATFSLLLRDRMRQTAYWMACVVLVLYSIPHACIMLPWHSRGPCWQSKV